MQVPVTHAVMRTTMHTSTISPASAGLIVH
jgi:hypothetical protein